MATGSQQISRSRGAGTPATGALIAANACRALSMGHKLPKSN